LGRTFSFAAAAAAAARGNPVGVTKPQADRLVFQLDQLDYPDHDLLPDDTVAIVRVLAIFAIFVAVAAADGGHLEPRQARLTGRNQPLKVVSPDQALAGAGYQYSENLLDDAYDFDLDIAIVIAIATATGLAQDGQTGR